MLHVRTAELGPGRSLHAVSGGEGADILLIHGALATHEDWLGRPFEALASLGRVTAIDRPGHGRSERPRFEGDPRAQARQVAQGLDLLEVGRAVLVGHSYGALTALALAELYPERVAALVLLAPLAFPEWRLLEHPLLGPRALPVIGPWLSRAGEATVDRPVLQIAHQLMFSPDPVPTAWEARYPYDQILTPEAMVAEGEDVAAILPGSPLGLIDVTRVQAPAHVVIGTGDKVVEQTRQGVALAAMLRRGRLTRLEGVGHMVHHARPDVLVDAVENALPAA